MSAITPPAMLTPEEQWNIIAASYGAAESTDEDTARRAFLDHIRQSIGFWEALPDRTVGERLDGLAFCLLSLLDGCAIGFPSYTVHANRADEDGNPLEPGPDIAGSLHEQFQRRV